MSRRHRESRRGVASTYEHFERDDVVAEYASFDFLLPPEQAILERVSPRLGPGRMLDVGVGAGRTTAAFASTAAVYVGVDVSTPMIEACRRRFPKRDLRFVVADVRDLPFSPRDAFDVVLFSFNSIDVVGDHHERLRALRSIRAACRPGGAFAFSTHNLHYAEARFSLPAILAELAQSEELRKPMTLLRRPRRLVRVLGRPFRWRALNTPVARLRSSDHAMVVEERPRYELSTDFYASPVETIRVAMYYIRPQAQVEQLAAIGFGEVCVFSPQGEDVTARVHTGLPEHWWLYYLCKRT